MKLAFYPACLLSVVIIFSNCTSKEDIKQSLGGRYAREFESVFDYFKDTLVIKVNDQSGFDITHIRWSSAKKDDPDRPVNKVAGRWNTSGPETVTGTYQQSDTTIRVEEQFSGRLRIISFDLSQDLLKETSFGGEVYTYKKVK